MKSPQLENIMKDFKIYLEELEKRLFILEENNDKFLRNYEVILSKEDLQTTKMKVLESDIKKQVLISEKIEEENNRLCNFYRDHYLLNNKNLFLFSLIIFFLYIIRL